MLGLRIIVTAAWTLAFMVAASLLLFALLAPLKADEVMSRSCTIGRVVFDQQMRESHHPFLITFPKDLSRAFIIAWNSGVDIPVSVFADTVSIYDVNGPYFRIGFFKGDCLVDVIDIGGQSFWNVIGAAAGPRRQI